MDNQISHQAFKIYVSNFEDDLLAIWNRQMDYDYDQSNIFNFPLIHSPRTQNPQQESSNNQTPPPNQHLESTSNENTPQPQKKNRKDAHVFSQNISSKTKSYICKLLAGEGPKELKKKVRGEYEKFLKEHKVENNQMILVFAYLFLLLSNAQQSLYAWFQSQFIAHLEGKLKNQGQKDEKEKQALRVKIKANMDLLVYLFSLKGEGIIDWDQIKQLSSPLFQGRQKKRIGGPLDSGMKIERQFLSLRQLDRQTSNQVALTYAQCF